MARTIHRNPMTSDTDLAEDVNYNYVNFASFKGLCDDKNYLGIDQQTFEDSNNVYVDEDGQLSSRPALKPFVIDVLPANYVIIKVFNIHGVIFYYLLNNGNTYEVHVKNKDEQWVSHECGDKLNIGWFEDKFYFFTNDTIFGYNYTDGWLTADSIIYIPVTREIRSGIIYTEQDDANIDKANIFTTSTIDRYVYSNTSTVDWSSVDGKHAIVTVGNERFEITLTKYSYISFVSPIYQSNITKGITNDAGQIVVWSDCSKLYYATGGNLKDVLFTRLPDITNSEGHEGSDPVLSQDGSRLFVFRREFNMNGQGHIDTAGELYTISVMDLTASVKVWKSYSKQLTNVDRVQWGTGLSAVYTDYQYLTPLNTAINSPATTVRPVPKPPVSDHWKPLRAKGYSNDGDAVIFISQAFYNVPYNQTSNISESYRPSGYTIVAGLNIYTFNTSDNSMFDFFDNGIGQGSEYFSNYLNVLHLSVGNVSFGSGTPGPRSGMALDFKYAKRNNRTYLTISTDGYTVDTNYHPSYNYHKKFIHTIVLNDKLIPYGKKDNKVFSISSVDKGYISYRCYSYSDSFIQVFDTGTSALSSIRYMNGLLSFHISPNESLSTDSTIIDCSVLADTGSEFITQDDTLVVNTTTVGDTSKINAAYGISDIFYTKVSNTLSEVKGLAAYEAADNVQVRHYIDAQNNIIIFTNRILAVNDLIVDTYSYDEYVYPISAMYGDGILYINNNTLYGVNLFDEIYVDIVIEGTLTNIIPSFICEFTNDVISYDNHIAWRTKEYDINDKGLLYFSKVNTVEFPAEVTALTLLSQTEVAIFFENEIRIFTYTSNGYIIQRSKLQLGCKKGNDVLLNYDGATTLLCTLKGLTAISYQDFVQSTDQVFTYLSENIKGAYNEYKNGELKLYQYKNWIIMYRQDSSVCYIYDLRNNSWWKWSCTKFIKQVVYDNSNLLVLMNGKLYTLESNIKAYNDFGYERIHWSLRSQKLHFGAPNNYKHINQFIITSTQTSKESYKFFVKFISYRNLTDVTNKEAYEYNVDGLKTFIKRMNLMKLNAFQFELCDYKYEENPQQFVTPNIAIKFRITERLR